MTERLKEPDYKKLYLELIKAVLPLTMAGGFKEQDRLNMARVYDRQIKIMILRGMKVGFMSSYIVYRKLKGSETVAIEDLIIVKQPHDGIIIKADSDLSKDIVGVPAKWLMAPEDDIDHPQDKKSIVKNTISILISIFTSVLCLYLAVTINNNEYFHKMVFYSIGAIAAFDTGRALRRLCE